MPPLVPTANGHVFWVLLALKALQHLAITIPPSTLPGPLTQADRHALAACSQLTYLDVPQGLVSDANYFSLFENRVLPHLCTLRATVGLVGHRNTVMNCVRCCPKHETVDIGNAKPEEDTGDIREWHDEPLDGNGITTV